MSIQQLSTACGRRAFFPMHRMQGPASPTKVNTEYQAVEVCRRARNDLWSFHVFRSGEDVELVSLGVHFPITAVYEDVTFPPEDDNIPA